MANGAPSRNGQKISASGAVDLAQARPLSPEIVEEGLFYAEMEAGKRCVGCGRRIVNGFRFTRFVVGPPRDGGKAFGIADVRTACDRADCDRAKRLRDESDCVELLNVRWLDEAGPEKPPPEKIAEMVHERRERQAQAKAEGDASG